MNVTSLTTNLTSPHWTYNHLLPPAARPSWVYWVFLKLRINLVSPTRSYCHRLGKGSRGGGTHLQGLLIQAVVCELEALVHLVRVTTRVVTISNEEGSAKGTLRWRILLGYTGTVLLALLTTSLMSSLMSFLGVPWAQS